MIEVCAEEGVSPKQVFFYFAVNGYSRKKSQEKCKKQLMKILGVTQKGENF